MLNITRKVVFAFIAFVGILIFGTVGYVLIEGWGVFDSFYMTVITVTTVGFGEVQELSTAGRAFSIVLILSGFGMVAVLASEVAKLLLEGDLKTVLWKRKMEKQISKLHKHYIVCGYGRVGATVVSQLLNRNVPVVVIDMDAGRIEEVKTKNCAVVEGDLLEDEVLLQAGIERAAGLISVLSRDSDNLLVALSARELNHNLHIVARGEHKSIEAKLKRAGADVVVSPHKISGEYIANSLFEPEKNKAAFMGMQAGDANHIAGYQVQTKTVGSDAGKTIAQMGAQKGVSGVVALTTVENEKLINPPLDRVVCAGEQLVILISEDNEIEKPKKVLVADDHAALRKLFVKKMRVLGYEVDEAVNGDEALAKIRGNKPDLVILDAMMPGLDGFTVCTRIKNDETLKDTKIVIFSNADPDIIREQSTNAGADAYLSKTVKSEVLTQTIKKLLG